MVHLLKSGKNLMSLALSLCLFMSLGKAQNADLQKTIPLDPHVRIGKLSNGMSYYIRKNVKPEKRVELRLAVNSGSVQEDDDQLGLAHFVEHMCFNGTKNFPKNDLIHYLQSVGVNFGPEINGYTSFDETVYMLTVPSDSSKILNNGLQIMEDWAYNVSFDATEIDKERGVLIEEWRLGRGAWQRMADKYMPVLFKDSKYAKRLPIGTRESIEGSKHEVLKRFYHEWYRPDLMAFIVVGDIDPDEIEQKIKNNFGKYEPPKNLRKKEEYNVPDNKETLISIVTDKENPINSIDLVYKTDDEKYNNLNDYRKTFLYRLFTGMINQRLNELKQQANPPFFYANAYYGDLWVRTKNAYQLSIGVGETGLERGLQTILVENERVKKFGFTQGEFDRYKKVMLKEVEKRFLESEKTESGTLVWQYVNHYLKGNPMPGVEFENQFINKYLAGISLDEVNQLAKKWISDYNRVIIIQGIDKQGVKLPTEIEIQNVITKAASERIEPYVEKQLASSLMPEKPKSGTVINKKIIDEIDVTELTLSNGVKVILKPSTFKNDEILLSAYSPGGQSLYPDDYHMSASNAARYMIQSGIGEFSRNDLEKMLAGKSVKVNPKIENYFEGISGSASKVDFETMMQLVYLYFTKPRKDAEAFQSFISKQKDLYKNLVTDPENYYFDQVERIRYNNHPRINALPTEADLNKISLDKIIEVYTDRFRDASDFTFILVGSFQVDSIKPVIETYLGGLPSGNRKESFKDMGIRMVKGPLEQKVMKGSDPKSYVYVGLESPAEWNRDDSHIMWSLGNILEKIYIDKLREEMSGVYGFGFRTQIEKFPYQSFNMELVIPCAPENVDKLVNAAMEEIKKIKANGVSDADLQKEIESQKRAMEKEAKENGSWLWKLEMVYKNGEDFTRFTNPESLIKLVNSKELQRIANKYFDLNTTIKIALYPEGYKK